MIEYGIYNSEKNRTDFYNIDVIISKIKDSEYVDIYKKFIVKNDITTLSKYGIKMRNRDYSFMIVYNVINKSIDIYNGYKLDYRLKKYIDSGLTLHDFANNKSSLIMV